MARIGVGAHPNLVSNWDTYRAIADFVDGSVDRVGQYLIPYVTESDGTPEGRANYASRLRRLYNINFCDPFLTLHWAHQSQPITIAGISGERMEQIIKDATGFRKGYELVARDRLWFYMRDGKVGTLVDGPATPATNRAEERERGERSYQVIYPAAKIRYWEHFREGPRKGQLRVLILEQEPETDERGTVYDVLKRFEAPDGPGNFIFETLRSSDPTPSAWIPTTRDVAFDVVEDRSGVGGLEEIPFVVMGEGPGESFVKDVWPLNLVHMNLKSVLSNIIHNTGFQRSIVVGADREELTKMGEWLVTILRNPDSRIFTVEPGNPEASFREIEVLENQIQRRAKFEYNQLSDDTRQVQSAESKAKDLITRRAIYDSTLDQLEEVEKQIYRFHALFEAAPADAIQVHIERDYGLEDGDVERRELDSLFVKAGQVQAFELQKEILRIRASRLRFLPTPTESEDEVRRRALRSIDEAEPMPPPNTAATLRAARQTATGFASTRTPIRG